MNNWLPEKRVLLRLLARQLDRRYRGEDVALSMIVVEGQIREAGGGALVGRWRRARQGVYRRKERDNEHGGWRYTLGVNERERVERETPVFSFADLSDISATAYRIEHRRIPAVNLAIGVEYLGYEKRDHIAAKLIEARHRLRKAVEKARRSE